ncbi:MAG: class I SAM-dependent methyltransferase [Candidatus Sumerlaeota bacterium]|nr:class I SAM-dependent methyltransferase [Candidatus Sumerlaeota bacterium]
MMKRDPAIKYHRDLFRPDQLKADDIDRLSAALVPPGCHLLEVGCATGYASEHFTKELGCTVLGIEYDEPQAEMARSRGLTVIAGSIEDRATLAQIQEHVDTRGAFDCIYASSVIEHLADGAGFLTHMKPFLKPTGRLIVTAPNIAHHTIRRRLLLGRFDYVEYGIMDRTHLHFYTIPSFLRLFDECGFCVLSYDIDAIDFPVSPWHRLQDVLSAIPGIGPSLRRRYRRLFANLIGYQVVVCAVPRSG